MAGIDKTYLNKQEYIQLRKFWVETREQQKKELGYAVWMYPFTYFGDLDTTDDITQEMLDSNIDVDNFGDEVCPVWSTSSSFDLWLAKNCPLDFIKERLFEQYDSDFIGFKHDFKFSEKPCLISITENGNSIYFFRTSGDDLKDGEINIHEKILFYGTTRILKIINQALNCISGFRFGNVNLKIEFEYFGVPFIYENGNIIHGKTLEPVDYRFDDDCFFIPKIKHSYKISDAKKYKLEEIFISSEDKCFDIAQFKEVDKKYLKRYIKLSTPDYINKLIK